MEKERVSDVCLLCVAAIWGINFVAVKFLLTEVSPVNLIFVRFFFGSILLFLLLFFFEDVKMPTKDLWRVAFLGLVGITLYQFLFTYALKTTSVTNVSIIINSAPLYGGVLSSLLGFEKFNGKRALGAVAGFFGVFIIITKGNFYLDAGSTAGNLLAVGASFLWALYTILSKPLLDRYPPLKVTTYSMITGSILFFPFVPFYSDFEEYAHLSVAGWVILTCTVIFSVVVAFFLWYRAVSKIGPSRTIIYQYAIPVFAAVFAWLLLGEKIYVSQIAGAAIVFSSIWFVRRG
ncbi:MAG: putative inner membrane transporter yiJE [Syntrophorhabdus sp. PtaU1.Bin050]|nr:MAG: putative inner membrane transporter yiJE [Syntrophorhabdus sp. PtaU1.Bin050]